MLPKIFGEAAGTTTAGLSRKARRIASAVLAGVSFLEGLSPTGAHAYFKRPDRSSRTGVGAR